jgi:hypothetical protein
MKVSLCCSVQSDIASTDIGVGIKINGTLVDCSVSENFNRNVGETYNISSIYVGELSEGDLVQIVIKCDQAGAVLTYRTFIASINEFFD